MIFYETETYYLVKVSDCEWIENITTGNITSNIEEACKYESEVAARKAIRRFNENATDEDFAIQRIIVEETEFFKIKD